MYGYRERHILSIQSRSYAATTAAGHQDWRCERGKSKGARKYFCVEKEKKKKRIRVVTWRHVCLGVGVEVLARHPSRRAPLTRAGRGFIHKFAGRLFFLFSTDRVACPSLFIASTYFFLRHDGEGKRRGRYRRLSSRVF